MTACPYCAMLGRSGERCPSCYYIFPDHDPLSTPSVAMDSLDDYAAFRLLRELAERAS